MFTLILVIIAAALAFQLTRYFSKSGYETADDRFNELKQRKQSELDRLLEKIHNNGIDSLSPDERRRLDELSE